MNTELAALARDHIAHPRNRGSFPPDVQGEILSGEAGSTASGAFVRFHLQVAAGRIMAARYEVLGAPELIAAVSYLSEMLAGREACAAAVPAGLDLARKLDLPRAEHGLALLAEDAARACLDLR